MKRDDDKIRVLIESTVAEFKDISNALEAYIKAGLSTNHVTAERVKNFKNFLDYQIIK